MPLTSLRPLGPIPCNTTQTTSMGDILFRITDLETRLEEFRVLLEQDSVELRQEIKSAREELKEIRLVQEKLMRGRTTLLVLSAGLTATYVVFPLVRMMVRGVSKIMD